MCHKKQELLTLCFLYGTAKTFTDLTVYMSNTTGVPSEAGTAYPLFPLSLPRLLPDLTLYMSKMTDGCVIRSRNCLPFVSSMALPRLLPDLTVYMSNTTGVPSEAGTAYPLFPLSLPRLLPDLTVYMSNTTSVPSEAGTAYPLFPLWHCQDFYRI